MRWISIEEASDAFERPRWALDKLIAEGKLERRVDADGRVFVRQPPTLDDLASELAPFLPDEIVPVIATIVADSGADGPEVLPETSREEVMLRAVLKVLERQHEKLQEIQRRQAVLALPAPPAPPPPTPRRSRFPVLVSALALVFAFGVCAFAQDLVERERERSDQALDQAGQLVRELTRSRVAPVTSDVAVIGSSTTLAAGFTRAGR